MKIAWLLPNLHISGGSRVAIEIGSRLSQKGHECAIYIPKGKNRFRKRYPVEIVECGVRIGNPFLSILTGSIGMLQRFGNADVIIASMPPWVLLSHWIGKTHDVPVVNYLLNDDVKFFDDGSHFSNPLLLGLYRFIAKLSIRKQHLIANSHWTAVMCVTQGGLRPEAIIPSGYDPGLFFPSAEKKQESKYLKLLTVGRKVRWKGLLDIINALDQCAARLQPFQLEIATQDDIQIPAKPYPVRILKPENDLELAEIYRTADIFLHGSWFEGFGLPPLESMACGVPVIATNSGGVREFLQDRVNCMMVPPRDPVLMKNAIIELSENRGLREKFVREGLETCRQFTWNSVTDQFERYMASLC